MNKTDLKDLEILDHKILKTILGAHSKVPIEQLYLETGSLPISVVIIVRRMSYLHTILKKHDDESVKKIYNAQKESPCKGDWINLVENDWKTLGIDLTDETIANMNKNEFKKVIKTKAQQHAFYVLTNMQNKHKKVKHIQYSNLNSPQQYLCSQKFNFNLSSLLFNLRCESVKNVKANFHTMYSGDVSCPLCLSDTDSQQHLLKCPQITNELSTKDKELLQTVIYSHIFGDIDEQYRVTRMFQTIIRIRERLLAARSLPGL